MSKGVYNRTPEICAAISRGWIIRKLHGYSIWNRGLTKETDERVARNVFNASQTHEGIIAQLAAKKGWITRRKNNNATAWNKGMYGLQVPWNKGLTKEIDSRLALCSQKMIGHAVTQETKNKISSKHKELRKDEEYSRRIIETTLKASRKRPTKPEALLTVILNTSFPGEWKYIGDGQVIIERKNPDFINVNGKKQIIDLFGTYWHSKEVTGRNTEEEEQRRIKTFARYGYRTSIIWQNELKDKFTLVKKIREWSNGK